MKHIIRKRQMRRAYKLAVALVLMFVLCGCAEQTQMPEDVPDLPAASPMPDSPQVPEAEPGPTPTPEPTPEPEPEPTPSLPPEETHSPLYISELNVEDVITYFNEVVLDAEFVDGGDPSKLQKWAAPIRYSINGAPTDADLQVLEGFAAWLNTVEGFPGISEVGEGDVANLRIYFCSQQELLDRMGKNYTGMDGAVTFWYMNDEIYDAIICIRTDLAQDVRNSVILEELYNGLGPVQDTDLREDSIIYSAYTIPQELTAVDELLLKLLYHPQLRCGMNAQACEEVIRQLYY